MKILDLVQYLEEFAEPALQESYDNSGMQVGDPSREVSTALLTLDVTEPVIEEAIKLKTNLIVAHHPLIFHPLKRITGANSAERCVQMALRNDIAIYAMHTNLDKVAGGVNGKICEKLGLHSLRVLQPEGGRFHKLVFFVPESHADAVRNAVFEAGGGTIGKYDMCSFNAPGFGTFRGDEDTDPFLGKPGQLSKEPELRIEVIMPKKLHPKVLASMLRAHPYEEVAYDIYNLENKDIHTGLGMIGELPEAKDEQDILGKIKETFNAACLRHTSLLGKPVKKIAVCGGSGAPLLSLAIKEKADLYLSADFKYHQFFEADGRVLIADPGHYESEQFTLEVFQDLLTKKFPKFAVNFAKSYTNPINYL